MCSSFVRVINYFGMKTPKKAEKIRTPSGTVITSKVKDIRGFFDADKNKFNCVHAKWNKQDSQTVTPIKRLRSHSTRALTLKFKDKSKDKVLCKQTGSLSECTRVAENKARSKRQKQHVASKVRKRSLRGKVNKALAPIFNTMEETGEMRENSRGDEDQSVLQKIKDDALTELNSTRQEIEQMLQDIESQKPNQATSEPAAMDIRSVMSMFKRINARLEKMETAVKMATGVDMTKKTAHLETKLNALESKAAAKSTVTQLQKQMEHYKFMYKVQGGTMQRMTDMLADITTRVDNIEISVNRRMMTISNLAIPESKEESCEHIAEFFLKVFDFRPQIEDCFTIGNGRPPLLVATFHYLEEKRFIMENRGLLKGITTGGRAHYINEYLPVAVNEKKRRDRELVSMLPENEVSFERGKTSSFWTVL